MRGAGRWRTARGKLPGARVRAFGVIVRRTWTVPKLSLRMTFLHVTPECARYNGHADLLREHIDGFTGT